MKTEILAGFPAHHKIKKIFLPRFDSFGDLVLLQGFLQQLKRLFPQAVITILVRGKYLQIAPLMGLELEWLSTELNPYQENINLNELETLVNEVRKDKYDLVILSCYSMSWLDMVVAQSFPDAWCVSFNSSPKQDFKKNNLLLKAGLFSDNYIDQLVRVAENLHETEKYKQLIKALGGGKEVDLPMPTLTIMQSVTDQVQEELRDLDLPDGDFAVCLPAGTANVALKIWPVARYAEILKYIEDVYNLPTLIIGHINEKKIIDELMDLTRERGCNSTVWLGNEGQFSVAAGLIARSRFCIGNDTGLVHVASVLEIPTLVLYGGGTFPRFLTTGELSVNVAAVLPCFGCLWDCHFDRALCYLAISVKICMRIITRIMGSSILPQSQRPRCWLVAVQIERNDLYSCLMTGRKKYDVLQKEQSQRLIEHEKLVENHKNLDGDHAQLIADYDKLRCDNATLIKNHENLDCDHAQLIADYDKLCGDNATLIENHENLDCDHAQLIADYDKLRGDNATLIENHKKLIENHKKLIGDHKKLVENHKKLIGDYEKICGDQ